MSENENQKVEEPTQEKELSPLEKMTKERDEWKSKYYGALEMYDAVIESADNFAFNLTSFAKINNRKNIEQRKKQQQQGGLMPDNGQAIN